MKKRFKAKVSGVFDIRQLNDSTFSETVEFLERNGMQVDKQFTNREECYIEACGDNGMRSAIKGDFVFTDKDGELFVMSEKRFNATYEEEEI